MTKISLLKEYETDSWAALLSGFTVSSEVRESLILCPRCQITFFGGRIMTEQDLISFEAARQVAEGHMRSRHHNICISSPNPV